MYNFFSVSQAGFVFSILVWERLKHASACVFHELSSFVFNVDEMINFFPPFV